MKCNLHLNSKGFTILELMITIFILVLMSAGIFRAVTQTFSLRAKLSLEGDFYQELRVVTNIINIDISHLYNPQAYVINTKENQLDPNQKIRQDAVSSSEFWGTIVNQTGVRNSQFIGEEDKVLFVSAANFKIYKNSPESIFFKVKYYLKKENDETILYREVNTDAFNTETDDTEEFTRIYPLLRGIEEFKFSYYEMDKEDWHKNWDTESNNFKGKYPDQIKVTIKLKSKPN